MKTMFVAVGALALTACGGGSVDEAACADICAKGKAGGAPSSAGSGSLSSYEAGLLNPLLEDIRGGVRPFNDEGIGICEGEKECARYLGREAADLAPGKYFLKGEFRVPNIGEAGTWKIRFDTDCTVVRKTASGESTTNRNSSREYDVRYAGTDRGYRIMPLRAIESPSKGGAESCKWKITAPHPDGDKVYEGSWSTPAAE